MLAVLTVFALAAMVLPTLARAIGTRVFWVAALVSFGAFVHTLLQAPARAQRPRRRGCRSSRSPTSLSCSSRSMCAWTRCRGCSRSSSRVSAVSCSSTAARTSATTRRAWAGSPPCCSRSRARCTDSCIADDVYLLFVFWEATSVFSYLLIGHYTHRKASRGAALQALITTTLGGLVMLVGLVLLAVQAGSSSLTPILATAAGHDHSRRSPSISCSSERCRSRRSCPLHFWLPGAMAAPTPVSAYLHAAAMVKAGIYLLLRLAPAFVEVPGWREVLVVLGLATMLLGGWVALKQTDLKLLLAYGTVSQLGFLVVVAGFGTRETALGALALLLAHALFKARSFSSSASSTTRPARATCASSAGLGRRSPVLAVMAAHRARLDGGAASRVRLRRERDRAARPAVGGDGGARPPSTAERANCGRRSRRSASSWGRRSRSRTASASSGERSPASPALTT
jgi:multicomponent Na+:H+ antiporter subunit A